MSRPFRLTRPEPPEHAIQDAVLRCLALDRRVAWAHRFNAGAMRVDEHAAEKARLLDRFAPQLSAVRGKGLAALLSVVAALLRGYYSLRPGKQRFLRFAFPGCSDILGQLVSGHLLAVEVKRPSTQPTEDQAAFLATVERNGGLALVARRVEDVQHALDWFFARPQPHSAEADAPSAQTRPAAVTGERRGPQRATAPNRRIGAGQ
jgi:hypothetical protein